jgi:hypothetical protein
MSRSQGGKPPTESRKTSSSC